MAVSLSPASSTIKPTISGYALIAESVSGCLCHTNITCASKEYNPLGEFERSLLLQYAGRKSAVTCVQCKTPNPVAPTILKNPTMQIMPAAFIWLPCYCCKKEDKSLPLHYHDCGIWYCSTRCEREFKTGPLKSHSSRLILGFGQMEALNVDPDGNLVECVITPPKSSSHFTLVCQKCQLPEPTDTKFKSCGRCSLIKYCSKECQLADWSHHKTYCKPNTTVSDAKSMKKRKE